VSEPPASTGAGVRAELGTSGQPRASKVVVAKASDIGVGERLIVTVDKMSIGVFNVDGRFYAFLNRCPHRGAQLCRGDVLSGLEADRPGELVRDVTRKYLVCPWHGWEFDIATGASWFDPGRMKARPFAVEVESGDNVADDVSEGRAVQPAQGGVQCIDPVTHRQRGPYQASVIPVEIENDYVVLSIRRFPATASSSNKEA
jgi:nitrite reductase/ring-hydroxylating ferredoxin subunit